MEMNVLKNKTDKVGKEFKFWKEITIEKMKISIKRVNIKLNLKSQIKLHENRLFYYGNLKISRTFDVQGAYLPYREHNSLPSKQTLRGISTGMEQQLNSG